MYKALVDIAAKLKEAPDTPLQDVDEVVAVEEVLVAAPQVTEESVAATFPIKSSETHEEKADVKTMPAVVEEEIIAPKTEAVFEATLDRDVEPTVAAGSGINTYQCQPHVLPSHLLLVLWYPFIIKRTIHHKVTYTCTNSGTHSTAVYIYHEIVIILHICY